MITTSPLGEGSGNPAIASSMPALPKRASKAPGESGKPEVALGLAQPEEAVSVSLQSQALASSTSETGKPSPSEEVSQRISQMVDTIQQRATSLDFQIEDNGHRVVVRVVNRATGEVIRQIPPEEMLRMSGAKDFRGLLLNKAS